MSTWDINLNSFSSEAERIANKFEKEAVARRLQAIFQDVQYLEQALSTLVEAFKGMQTGRPCPDWILGLIRKGVDNRCCAIAKV